MAQKINPFAHVADSDHIEIFETMGWVIHLPNIHVFGHEVPIKFMLLMTVCAVLVGAAVLLAADRVTAALGRRGASAVQRLMGMLLTTVSVQMFLTGLKKFLDES